MKKKIIVILVMMLLIATTLPVVGTMNISKNQVEESTIESDSSQNSNPGISNPISRPKTKPFPLPPWFMAIVNNDWDYWTNPPDMFAIPEGNVGIGTENPNSKLEVVGMVHSTTGGFKFPDGSVQTTAGTGGMSFETGTIAHGSTIPLPAGYTQEECKWMVSINTLDTFDGGLNQRDQRVICNTDSNRVVTCKLQSYSGGWIDNTYGIANYMIIGIK